MKKPSGKKVFSSCCYEPIKVISGDEGTSFYACAGCGECVNPDGSNPTQPFNEPSPEERKAIYDSFVKEPVVKSMSVQRREKIQKDEKTKLIATNTIAIPRLLLEDISEHLRWCECHGSKHAYNLYNALNPFLKESVESRDEKEGSSWEIDTIKNLEQQVEGLENTTKSLWSSLSLLNSIMKDLEQRIDELKEERLEQGSSIGELLQRIDNWEEMLNHLKEKHNEFGHVFEASTRNMWTEIGLLTERVEKLTKPIWKKKKS